MLLEKGRQSMTNEIVGRTCPAEVGGSLERENLPGDEAGAAHVGDRLPIGCQALNEAAIAKVHSLR
jgi:hypothetical protein